MNAGPFFSKLHSSMASRKSHFTVLCARRAGCALCSDWITAYRASCAERGAGEFYCEPIAAFKLRSCNRKGWHISTVRAIEILENYGLETPRGLVKPKPGVLRKTTVNRYLKQWGHDHVTLTRPPPAARFEARHSSAARFWSSLAVRSVPSS